MRKPVLTAILLLLSSVVSAQPTQGVSGTQTKTAVTIEITGLSSEMLNAVEGSLSIYLQRDHPLLSAGIVRRLHDKAPQEIRRALEPFGYYHAKVERQLTRSASGWTARYDVALGEPIRVRHVDIVISGPGATEPVLQRWHASFPLNPGDVLVHRVYEDAKGELLDIARGLGYVDGQLERHEIAVDLQTNSADIKLLYATGPRYRFGSVDFEQDVFADDFLRRYLPFHRGDRYDIDKLIELQRALSNSDYFEYVQVEPQVDKATDEEVPIRIRLTPRKQFRYDVGIGYTTDTGPRGTLGFQNRRATSYGHHFVVVVSASEVLSNASASYLVPLRRPQTDSIAYSAQWEDENTDTVLRTTNSLSAMLTRVRGQWKRGLGISYERERYRVESSDNSTLLIPLINWQRLWGRNRIHTLRGALFNAELRGAVEGALSDTTFLQIRTNGKMIESLGMRDRVLMRAEADASWTSEFSLLPASQRFFAGGDQSIRGYAYKSLGPIDVDGTVIGGTHMLIGSLEYEHIFGNIYSMALFYDSGNAFNKGSFTPVSGAGIGMRWRLPFGAMRIDVAYALSEPDHPWRLHINIGPDL